ncbi:hypothetical protein NL676_000457 [Syzygium grande]|nr:hypothetical protein NL676_000457 [Syzygium grande]
MDEELIDSPSLDEGEDGETLSAIDPARPRPSDHERPHVKLRRDRSGPIGVEGGPHDARLDGSGSTRAERYRARSYRRKRGPG